MREVSASGDVAQLPDALGDNDHGKGGHGGMLPHATGKYQLAGSPSHLSGHPLRRLATGRYASRIRKSKYSAGERNLVTFSPRRKELPAFHRRGTKVKRRFSMARVWTLLAAFALVGTMFTGLGGVASAESATADKAAPGVQALLFQIRPRDHDDKCLDSSQSGPVRQVTCASPAVFSQLWQVLDTSQDGVVKIKSKLGQCLDVAGAGTTNGTPVNVFPCGTQTNQTFVPTFSTGSFYRIRTGHSLGDCLDIKNDVPAEGAPLQLWDCLPGQTNQQFTFVSA
jgi:hypothetical protein